MNRAIKNILIGVCCLSFTFGFTLIVSAQANPPATQTELERPTGPGTSADSPLVFCGGKNKDGSPQKECQLSDLNKLIQDILNLTFMFAGFIVAGMFMYAGFLLITSVGDTGKIQKAKDIFRRVVIGFLIMSLSYIIVKNLVTSLLGTGGNDGIRSLFMGLFK